MTPSLKTFLTFEYVKTETRNSRRYKGGNEKYKIKG